MTNKMTKKIFFAIIAILTLAMPHSVKAQWEQMPLRGIEYSNMIETNTGIVYYLSENMLSSINQNDNEYKIYSTSQGLSGGRISKLFYNYDKNYLVIVYDDANIDIVYDNGSVANLPDIRDAQMGIARVIYDVAFAPNRMLVGTNFGLVVFNPDKLQVAETMFTDYPVALVTYINGHYGILVAESGNYNLWLSPKDVRHNTLDSFTKMYGIAGSSLFALADKYIVYTHENGVYITEPNFEYLNDPTQSPRIGGAKGFTQFPNAQWLLPSKRGGFVGYTTDKFFEFSAEGELVDEITLTDDLKNNALTSWEGATKVYAANVDGVGCYDISGATPTVLSDRYLSEAITVVKPFFMEKANNGSRVYMTRHGTSNILDTGYPEGNFDSYPGSSQMRTNYVDGDRIVDVTVTDKNTIAYVPEVIKENGRTNYAICGGFNGIAINPQDEDEFFIANLCEGIYRIKGGQVVGLYNPKPGNFPATDISFPKNCSWNYNVKFDPRGNLWATSQTDSRQADKRNLVLMLPKDKVAKDPSEVLASDWIVSPVSKIMEDVRTYHPMVVTQSGILFITSAGYGNSIYIADTKNTDTPDDDDIREMHGWQDQDAKNWNPARRHKFFEDRQGRVWVGTSDGVFLIPDPTKCMSPDFRIERVKVARNDGSILADYLLEDMHVYDIDQDAQGNMWFATNTGVTRTDENASKILEQYNATNSNLVDGVVCAVATDNVNNIVYIGTQFGAMKKYIGAGSGSTDDKAEITVAPNPVRPDYFGLVSISGLPTNSMVKISDNRGNVVYQGTADAVGTMQWDACNASGARVKSGVYYVLASPSSDDGQKAATAKIVVIN